MSRVANLFEQTSSPILNVYFTAGYPALESTRKVLKALQSSGADMVEIGMPYSDPLADGDTIQESSMVALENGMSIEILFEQLTDVRAEIDIPIVLMGYLNPILQFGPEAFFQKCQKVGVDGLIIPDLPQELFDAEFGSLLKKYGLDLIFLITPETSEDRILAIDDRCSGFLYVVSSSATTGSQSDVTADQKAYFDRVNKMGLKNNTLIGFGISDSQSFQAAAESSAGAIVGSAFIRQLKKDASYEAINEFVKSIKS